MPNDGKTIMPIAFETLAAFTLASLVLLAVPGPTIIMVVTQALTHGRRVALASVAGVGLGDFVAASLSLIGVGTILATSSAVFLAVKWAGAAYLVYLGVRMWRTPVTTADIAATAPAGGARPGRLFRDAFLVTVLNPKSIVFFMAFLPQFVRADQAFVSQAVVLVTVFVVLGMANAYAYILIAASARGLFRSPSVLRRISRTGAAFLMAAGIGALLTRRAAA